MALPIADTTTITSLPRFFVNATLSATALMRSGSATDVPPYFWTIRATGTAGYKRTTIVLVNNRLSGNLFPHELTRTRVRSP